MQDAALQACHHPDCYPSAANAALDFFRQSLQAAGETKLPLSAAGRLTGIITPHIDFRVSMASYGAAFWPLLEVPLADSYVILGVGHRSRLDWNLDGRDYATPLGRVACDKERLDFLVDGLPMRRLFGPAAHVGEHSIEFPLLWLQALHALHPSSNQKPFRYLPILCGGLQSYVAGQAKWDEMDDFHLLAQRLGSIMSADSGRHAIRVIVSIDGCHLGPRFQHPFRVTPAILSDTAAWEQELWNCAEKGDARHFLDWMREEGNDRYFDGVGALALLLAAGGGDLRPQRTYYEQWFTERDASAVTFSSGRVLTPGPARAAGLPAGENVPW